MPTQLTKQKSCDPQRFADEPQANWGVEDLGRYARARHDEIAAGEQSLAAAYWRLGAALNLARRQFGRGQWGKFLAEFGIEKTRASKARAIHQAFGSKRAVERLSVQEAYSRRERRSRKTTRAKRGERNTHQPSLTDFLLDICQMADTFLDDAGGVGPHDAAAVLPIVEAAVEELTKLQHRLRSEARPRDEPAADPSH